MGDDNNYFLCGNGGGGGGVVQRIRHHHRRHHPGKADLSFTKIGSSAVVLSCFVFVSIMAVAQGQEQQPLEPQAGGGEQQMMAAGPGLPTNTQLEFINPESQQEQELPAEKINEPIPEGQIPSPPPQAQPGPDFQKIALQKVQQNCKPLGGALQFCDQRTYSAFVGNQDPNALDGQLVAKWNEAKQMYVGKGSWCSVAYKKVLCAYYFPFCVSGDKKYMPCKALCIDYCNACGVCGPVAAIPGSGQGAPGMDPAIVTYCTSALEESQNPRECTEARTCGWLDIPARMPTARCLVLNH